MPRPSNRTERRAQIVAGLARAMARRGYERASIQTIARDAGLTPGLVHYHFRTKQEVLLALVDDLAGRLRERFEQRLLRAGRSPLARLDAFIEAHLAHAGAADAWVAPCWVAIGAEALRQPQVRLVYSTTVAAQLAEVRAMVRSALLGEGRRTSQAKTIATAILAAINGAHQLGTAAEAVVPSEFSASTIKHMARGLIRRKLEGRSEE